LETWRAAGQEALDPHAVLLVSPRHTP